MTSAPARQPPQNQVDPAGARTDSIESGARSGAITVSTVLAANRANANDVTQDISALPAESGGSNDDCVIVSPVQDSQGHDRIDFPTIYSCPFLLNEPPVAGAYFDIPGEDGQISEQVFENSCLFRHIATLGSLRGYREVCHLLNGGWVSWDEALALVCRVHVETQVILNAERGHLGLLLVDNQPVR